MISDLKSIQLREKVYITNENKLTLSLFRNWGCGHFLGLPMQLIQENACILPGSNNLVFPSFSFHYTSEDIRLIYP